MALASLPGGNHGGAVHRALPRRLEGEREVVLTHLEVGHQRRGGVEVPVGLPLDPCGVEVLETLGELEGLLAGEAHLAPHLQAQVLGELPRQASLARLVPGRERVLGEGHQASGVHPRHRRVAVDEQRQHRQLAPLAAGLEHQARRGLRPPGEPPGAHVHGDAGLEVREHLAHQLGHRLGTEDPPLAQAPELLGGEVRVAHGLEGVAAAHHPAGEDLLDARILDHLEREAAPVVLHHRHHPGPLGGAAHRGVVQAHLADQREGVEEPGQGVAGEPPGELGAERPLHLPVRRRHLQGRAVHAHPPRHQRRQGVGDGGLGAVLGHPHPLELQPLRGPGEAVAHARLRRRRPHWERLAGLLGLAPGDDPGGDVLAGILVAPAVAAPVEALGIELHGPGRQRRRRGHHQHQRRSLLPLARDGALAVQLHPPGPGTGARRFADLLEQGIHRGLSTTSARRYPRPGRTTARPESFPGGPHGHTPRRPPRL